MLLAIKPTFSLARERHPVCWSVMSWRDFERLDGEAFRMRGYSVTETGGGGADGGVDLQLARGSETFLVQCKH